MTSKTFCDKDEILDVDPASEYTENPAGDNNDNS